MTAPERPGEFEAVVSIAWSNAATPAGLLPGWLFRVRMEDGTQILTATALSIHATADGITWAEVTMFADAAGRPVYRTPADWEPHFGADGELAVATFPFLVSGMSVLG